MEQAVQEKTVPYGFISCRPLLWRRWHNPSTGVAGSAHLLSGQGFVCSLLSPRQHHYAENWKSTAGLDRHAHAAVWGSCRMGLPKREAKVESPELCHVPLYKLRKKRDRSKPFRLYGRPSAMQLHSAGIYLEEESPVCVAQVLSAVVWISLYFMGKTKLSVSEICICYQLIDPASNFKEAAMWAGTSCLGWSTVSSRCCCLLLSARY